MPETLPALQKRLGDGSLVDSSGPLDRLLHTWIAKFTLGLSPVSYQLALHDWAQHLALSPSKQLSLMTSAVRHMTAWHSFAFCGKDPIDPEPLDRRFKSAEWDKFPYNLYQQYFLHYLAWWKDATENVRGVKNHHQDLVSFVTRQMIDMAAPSNFLMTNPCLMQQTLEEKGANLVTGFLNLQEDLSRLVTDRKPVGTEEFVVGETLATTPGKVIYRNELMELIQYKPSTKDVHAEPLLIIPAWIMKYYILDLSVHNSLVKYMVDQGHTVFIISWINPTKKHKNIGLNDYLEKGLFEALNVVQSIAGDHKIHAAGYCLGGTLLSMAAAWVGKQEQHPFKTITLFTAQTDFEEAGELQLFTDESQLAFLEDMTEAQGYLDKHQMKGIFQWLRSNELIWSNMISNYLMGKRALHNDLMAWNADATRMPHKMMDDYLRKLFLKNELAEGKYKVDHATIALSDIDVPIFSVATQWDHIAPWPSVYKIHLLTNTEITFLLTTGGHNAGIVSEPGHANRSYQMKMTPVDARYITPEDWRQQVPIEEGSWWPAWQQWLVGKSSGEKIPAPQIGSKDHKPLYKAPGRYVMG